MAVTRKVFDPNNPSGKPGGSGFPNTDLDQMAKNEAIKNAGIVKPVAPTPPPTAAPPPTGGQPIGTPERPRDRPIEQPTAPVAPQGVPRAGLPGEGAAPAPPQVTAAPPKPKEPMPTAEAPPEPFTPMAPPPAVFRKSLTGTPALPSSHLLGGAGGLLGGGLGVPGIASGDSGDVSALIQAMLKRAR